MFLKRSVRIGALLAFFTLVVGSTVLADDGRINHAPYHFGGDTLFCSQETGCTLLDKEGHALANWPQNDVATAFAAADSSGQNAQVTGEGQGTYGPMQLWAVSPDATTGNNTLCMIGFDEWDKQNDMCFQVTKDWHYEPAPLPVQQKVEPTAAPTPVPPVPPIPTPPTPPIPTPPIPTPPTPPIPTPPIPTPCLPSITPCLPV